MGKIYSLTDGFNAISAYGVLVLANLYLCKYIEEKILGNLQRQNSTFPLSLPIVLLYFSMLLGIPVSRL